jgi:hypothetical protein
LKFSHSVLTDPSLFSFCQVAGCVARSKQAAELARVPAVETLQAGDSCSWPDGYDLLQVSDD